MSDLFQGTLHFVQVAFTTTDNPPKTSIVSTQDMQTAISYAQRAVVPISLYAKQYGDNSIGVSSNIITYNFQFSGGVIDDNDIQTIVNDTFSRLPKDACIVILLPPDIDNSKHSRLQGTGGYHEYA